MNAHDLRMGLAAGVCLLIGTLPVTRAATTTMDISTATPTNWKITGGGATNATPDVISGSLISLTSDGTAAGTPIAGFNNSAFDGVWTATYTFSLPADATGATLNYSNLFADDRTVLLLNGTQVANMASDGPGAGAMVLSSGGAETPFTFTNNTSGTITTGLNAGSANTLTAVINNTTSGRNGTLVPLVGPNGTDFSLAGTISFATGGGGGNTPAAVPVPPAAWTGLGMLIGLTGLGALRRRRVTR
jgi:hypothetical protein